MRLPLDDRQAWHTERRRLVQLCWAVYFVNDARDALWASSHSVVLPCIARIARISQDYEQADLGHDSGTVVATHWRPIPMQDDHTGCG